MINAGFARVNENGACSLKMRKIDNAPITIQNARRLVKRRRNRSNSSLKQ
jgi:hypothetical protein